MRHTVMKNNIKNIISLFLLAVICILTLTACVSLDRAEEKLIEAGYTVVRYGEGAPAHLESAVDENVVSSLKATGGPNGEHITIIRFKDKETAEQFEALEKKYYENSYFMTVKREGKTVIYGWTAAYEVIK